MIGSRKTWAAISTHQGEEQIVAQVHHMLKARHRDLLTIIVPRHPDRAIEIAAEIEKMGMKVALRSRGDQIAPDTDIYLGDTIGDMGLYLRVTEVAFVGRSLTAQGGQNPLEPAMLRSAILSGRNVQNFRDLYQRLIKNGGAKLVRDKDMLAGAVNYLFNNPEERQVMIDAGLKTVEDMRGSLTRTMTALEPFIQPLVLQARLSNREGGWK